MTICYNEYMIILYKYIYSSSFYFDGCCIDVRLFVSDTHIHKEIQHSSACFQYTYTLCECKTES